MFDYLAELGLPEEVVSFFFTFFIGAIAVSAVIGIAIYLLESISVYKMAKSAEIKNPWLAFVPVANDWVFGTLAEKYKKKNGTKSARFGGNSAYRINSSYNIYGNFRKGNYGLRT